MRTAGGLFNWGEVLSLFGERRWAALDLGVSAGSVPAPIIRAAVLASAITLLRIVVLLEPCPFRAPKVSRSPLKTTLTARPLCNLSL